MKPFYRSRLEKFVAWWRAPATRKDRVLGALVGAFSGFWLGLLSVAMFSSAASEPKLVVLAVVAVCALAGAVFPKTATVLLFPFGVMGGSV